MAVSGAGGAPDDEGAAGALGLQLRDACRRKPGHLVLEVEHPADALEVHALGGQPLHLAQQRDVARGVAPAAAGCASRHDQPQPVVRPQRLRVQAGELGRDRDDVDRQVLAQG